MIKMTKILFWIHLIFYTLFGITLVVVPMFVEAMPLFVKIIFKVLGMTDLFACGILFGQYILK